MSIAIGTFVNFNDRFRFQNFFQGEVRRWKDQSYLFAGFGYSGSTTDLQNGNVDASLVFNNNEMSMNLATEAANNRWIVEVMTVWLNPSTLEEERDYMTDTFMVTAFEHDHLRLNIKLASPLDAITGDVPRRRLTEKLVGALPSTGQVQLL